MATSTVAPLSRWRRRRVEKSARKSTVERSLVDLASNNSSNNQGNNKAVWAELRDSLIKGRGVYGRNGRYSDNNKKAETKPQRGVHTNSANSTSHPKSKFGDDASVQSTRSIVSQNAGGTGNSWGRVFHTLPASEAYKTEKGSGKRQSRKKKKSPKKNTNNHEASPKKLPNAPHDNSSVPSAPPAPPCSPCWGDLGSIQDLQITGALESGSSSSDDFLSLSVGGWQGQANTISDGGLGKIDKKILNKSPLKKKRPKGRRSSKKDKTARPGALEGLQSPMSPCWGDLGNLEEMKSPEHRDKFDSKEKLDQQAVTMDNWEGKVKLLDSFENIPSMDGGSGLTSGDCSWRELIEISSNTVTPDYDATWLQQLVGDDKMLIFEETEDSKDEEDATLSLKEGSFLKQFNENVRSNLETEERMETPPQSPKKIGKKSAVIVPPSPDLFCDAVAVLEKEDSMQRPSTSSSSDDGIQRVRSIRFADEQGLPMEQVHHLGGKDDPLAVGRLVILYLSPEEKKFEFLHAEYFVRANATVLDLLQQLPGFATSEMFAALKFESLYRIQDGPSEIDTSSFLHDCGFDKHEVNVAVMKGASGDDLVQAAIPLLDNPRIMRAVKHAKRTGRGLKYIMSAEEMEEDEAERKEKEEREEWDVPNLSEDANNEDVKLPTFPSVQEEPRQMMQFLHAGLVATIGVLYSMSYAQ